MEKIKYAQVYGCSYIELFDLKALQCPKYAKFQTCGFRIVQANSKWVKLPGFGYGNVYAAPIPHTSFNKTRTYTYAGFRLIQSSSEYKQLHEGSWRIAEQELQIKTHKPVRLNMHPLYNSDTIGLRLIQAH